MKRVLLAALLAACAKKAPPAPAVTTPTTYAECKTALEKNQLDVAERCFTARSVAAEGDDAAHRADVLFALAEIRQERGDGKGAVSFALRAVALRPTDAEAQDLLASIAHDAGDRLAEKSALAAVCKLDPDSLDGRLKLAGLIAGMEGGDAAKSAFLDYEDTRVRLATILGKDPDPLRRRQAAQRLAGAHDAGTARALVLAMTDKDAGVRAQAVRSVAQVGLDLDPDVRPALKKLGSIEADPGAKGAIVEALAASK